LRLSAAHVELAQEAARAVEEPSREEPAESRIRLVPVVVQREVFCEAELEHEPAELPVLWNVALAGIERVARVCARDVLVSYTDTPCSRLAEAGERVDQLCLAVPVDPCQPHDLAGTHLEGNVADGLQAPVVPDCEACDAQERLARLSWLLLDPEEHLAADHQPSERLGGRALAGQCVDLLASSQDGDAVGDPEHLVQLVTDEDDGHALSGQGAQDCKELLRLLRGQHRGRLVEDEHIGAAVEGLQDLHALLLADADVLDTRPGIDDELECARDLLHARDGGVVVEEDAGSCRLRRENDVLGDGHDRDEHEVLVHHPDPEIDRVPRRMDRDGFPLDPDFAFVGVVEAVQDVHERRFAGPVLTEERVHLAATQVEIDMVVGHDAGEAFDDPLQLEERRLAHAVQIVRGQTKRPPPVPIASLLDLVERSRRVNRPALQVLVRLGDRILHALRHLSVELRQQLRVG